MVSGCVEAVERETALSSDVTKRARDKEERKRSERGAKEVRKRNERGAKEERKRCKRGMKDE